MSHFNKEAATWDDPKKIQLMKILAEKTISALKLNNKVDILDFGCGTGLFGLEFSDYLQTLVGIDTSDGMLDVFNQKTKDADNISSVHLDLKSHSLNQTFDLIVSSMAFHHLETPDALLQKLKTMLNPGGTIAIVDLDEEDGTFHPNNKEMGVKHFGFTKSTLETWASNAKLSLSSSIIHQIEKEDKTYAIFLAMFQ